MISEKSESIIPMEGGGSVIPRVTDDSKLLDVESGCNFKSRLLIEFNNLSYSVGGRLADQKQKDILRSVSGHFRPGRLTAILGPSGAGKTSLLSIISGSRGSNLKGSITVNGVERKKEIYRKQACYIPQDFALLPLLTVRETLQVAADLKLGLSHTAEFKRRAVNDVATKLGLLACLDTAAGHLSGGERKRLSIGVELISNPPIMLLDEPTSGLDSAASAQVISVLHTLAEGGQTVVCTVHQPGSKLISLFHDVVVLSRGRIIYCGPRDEILDTFACAGYRCPQLYNIAEFVLETVTESEDNLERLSKVCREKFESKKLHVQSSIAVPSSQQVFHSLDLLDENEEPLVQKGRYSNSEWRQFVILYNRAMICLRRDNTLTKLRVCAHLIVGILIGIVFYDFGNDAAKIESNIACVFTGLLFLFFGNSMPAVQMFPIEAAVFFREHLNNWYSLQSYYIAKVLADIPLQVICPTCFLAFSYWLTGQPLEFDRIWRVWLICVLLTMLAQSFGIAAGAACGAQCGVFLVPALNIPMFLFAGFFVKLGEVASYLKPLCYISYFRYAFEGYLQGIYGNTRKVLPCSKEFCPVRLPSYILSNLGMPTMPFYVLTIILVSWILLLHICVYTVFRWKLHRATK